MPGSHNITEQREELKSEIKKQEDPKEVEASATITRRTSAGGRTNLMKRGGNLMSSGKSKETVQAQPLKPVVEEKLPAVSEEPEKEKKKSKKFLGKVKDFLGGSVAVVSNATNMMTNPVG
jgi:hypothetical protein